VPRRTRQKALSLSIYLIKTGIEEQNVFRSRTGLSSHAVSEDRQRMGRVYIKQSDERPPSWMRLFVGRASPRLGTVLSKNASALWLVPIGGRLFASAFGYGRMLLDQSVFEEDFGLKVTLNCVDPTKVHSIDRTTLDTISRHSQIQASHLAPIGEFGLDVEQDILQAVTGEPSDTSLGKKLSGKDALHTSVVTDFRDLPALFERYLALYQSDRYKEFFAFVDHIRLIKDPRRIESLNAALVERIRTQNADRLWLSIPEAIEWRKVDHFRYRPSRRKGQYNDLHFSQLVSEINNIGDVDVDTLRYIRVEGVSAETGMEIYDWQLFKCLNHEVVDGSHTHVLNNGKWYEVASDFATAVAETCQSVRPSASNLPEYQDRDEAAYNVRVASSDPSHFVSCDRNVVVFPSGPSRIEFCDLYTDDRELIFVKRYADSSVLSHLFAQGVVSAETFRRERRFRQLVNQNLPATHRLGTEIDDLIPQNFTITFAVISESARPLHESQPFFSKVNLRNAVKLLESNGYNVRLAKIQQRRQASRERTAPTI
jgi:uncharacterized protein (TIGR04141 family)